MDRNKKDLISIMRYIVCQDETTIPLDVDWEIVWNIAQRNHLEAIVFKAMPENIACQYRKEYFRIVSRSVQQNHLLLQIEDALEKAGIPYALQKGSILKNDYPDITLRFMSDIDLYIQPEYRSQIRTAMESIDGKFCGKESGDEQFVFLDNLGVEYHGRLLYKKAKHGIGIENYSDWGFVDESRNRLTEEGYALNLIGHVVSDLSKGGPGIRYILDLWVYRHRHKTQPDWDAVWKRMKQDKIDIAAKNLIDLSEYLFGDGEETELLKELSEYVLSGELYGDAKRSAASEAARAGGISGAFFRQIFRNRSEYENRYPWLKEYRFLFPVAMLLRIVKSLKGNRNRIKMWIFDIKTIKRDDIKTQYECLSRFGL